VPRREAESPQRHAPAKVYVKREEHRFTTITGDVFAAPADRGLAHCVALDFGMSAGIAVDFKRRFGPVIPSDRARARVGTCLHMVGPVVRGEQPRELFYLVSKRASAGAPTYGSLETALRDMVVKAEQRGVARIAMPRIGCGLD